jgi:chromosome segregation ATPase
MGEMPSPEEMQSRIEQIKQKMDELEGKQEDAESSESKAENLSSNVKENQSEVAADTNEAEEKGNPDELEDAAEEEKSVERLLEKQEELIEQSIQDIENQVKIYALEDEEIEEEEKDLHSSITSTKEEIAKIFNQLRENAEEETKRITVQDLEELENHLEKLINDAKIFTKLITEQEQLMDFFQRTEKEQFKLENSIQEIRKELEMTKKEVKQLLLDTEQLNDQRGYQEAEAEKENLQKLLQEYQEEKNEEETINQKIQQEIQESKVIINKDEQIIEEMQQTHEMLEELKQFLKNNKGHLISKTSRKTVKTLLTDLPKAQAKLENAIQKEDKTLNQLKNQASQAIQTAQDLYEETATNQEGNKKKSFEGIEWLVAIPIGMAVVIGAASLLGWMGAASALAILVIIYYLTHE